MAVDEFTEITLHSRNINHYKDLEYDIPYYKDKSGRIKVKRGTKLVVLTKDLTNSKIIINGICDNCGEPLTITSAGYFHDKNREYILCKECNRKKLKVNYDYLLEICSNLNYQLVTSYEEYYKKKEQKYEKIQYICSKHSELGIQEVCIHDLIGDYSGCRSCGNEKISEIRKLDINIARQRFFDVGLVLVENNYVHSEIPMECFCEKHKDKGYQYKKLTDVTRGAKCTFCVSDNLILKNKQCYGENAHNWKGGVTSERTKIWHSQEYQQWRNAVFERDSYTCQCCGDNKGGNLQAHHKYNFSDYIDLRFNVDFGITLCDKCHDFRNIGSFHNVYHTKNNTPEQLDEYINNYREMQRQEKVI